MFSLKMARRIVDFYEKNDGKELKGFGANYTAYAHAKRRISGKEPLIKS